MRELMTWEEDLCFAWQVANTEKKHERQDKEDNGGVLDHRGGHLDVLFRRTGIGLGRSDAGRCQRYISSGALVGYAG